MPPMWNSSSSSQAYVPPHLQKQKNNAVESNTQPTVHSGLPYASKQSSDVPPAAEDARATQNALPSAEPPAALPSFINAGSKVEKVKIDGVAVLKIIQHSTESLPDLCSGAILGMVMDNALEINNCVPFPPSNIHDESNFDDSGAGENGSGNDGLLPMGNSTDPSNAFNKVDDLLPWISDDFYRVGCYRSVSFGSFCTSDLLKSMFQFHEDFDMENMQKSVLIVYDPYQSKRGSLHIKAYRLTDAFMKVYRERNKKNAEGVVTLSPAVVTAIGGLETQMHPDVQVRMCPENELTADNLIEELPIEITNPHLFSVLVDDLHASYGDRLDVDFDRFKLGTNSYLAKNLGLLVDKSNNFGAEQNRFLFEKKRTAKTEQDQIRFILQRRAENETRKENGEPVLPEIDPSNQLFKVPTSSVNLESLLVEKQISVYTDQINKFAGTSLAKLYLANAIYGNSNK